ncbi:unnamed protein product [Phytomonas sp. Hart1]|nr:unnamed protein product [Phytomonas sp. Hart1]|eukprot:CCW68813.1 unnamed protein product [Phytomonas sp. isolate Hart1]
MDQRNQVAYNEHQLYNWSSYDQSDGQVASSRLKKLDSLDTTDSTYSNNISLELSGTPLEDVASVTAVVQPSLNPRVETCIAPVFPTPQSTSLRDIGTEGTPTLPQTDFLRKSFSTQIDELIRASHSMHHLRSSTSETSGSLFSTNSSYVSTIGNAFSSLGKGLTGTLCSKKTTCEDNNVFERDDDVSDVSMRHEKLSPLSIEMEASLDRHEVPKALGGDDLRVIAFNPVHKSNRKQGGGKSSILVNERLPVNTEAEFRQYRSSFSESINVTTVKGYSNVVTKIQLTEQIDKAISLIEGIHAALDEAEKLICPSSILSGSMRMQSKVCPSKGQTLAIVQLCARQHLPFFSSTQHVLELSPEDRMIYEAKKNSLLQRLQNPSSLRRASDIAQDGNLVHYVCVATLTSGQHAIDLGAEIFFACTRRYILSTDNVKLHLPSTMPLASKCSREVLEPSVLIGFPSLCYGLFPSAQTINTVRFLKGVYTTVKLMAQLVKCDVRTLETLGLLKILRYGGSDKLIDISPFSALHPSKGYEPILEKVFCDRNISRSETPMNFGVRAEYFILTKICKNPPRRQWVLERFILPSAFQRACSIASNNPILNEWYEYFLASVTHDMEDANSVCLQYLHQHIGLSHHLNAATVIKHVVACQRTLPHPPHSTSMHDPMSSTSKSTCSSSTTFFLNFICFKAPELPMWEDKSKALLTGEICKGTTVLYDCSPSCVSHTLDLINQHQDILWKGREDSFSELRVILMGDFDDAMPVLERLPYATLISQVSCFSMHNTHNLQVSLQQVRTFAETNWPESFVWDNLSAALCYLQSIHAPYVVCATPAMERIITAFCLEACRLVSVCDAEKVERAAVKHLGLTLGPLRLMDIYGIPKLLRMFDSVAAMGAIHPHGASKGEFKQQFHSFIVPETCTGVMGALRLMEEDGFLGKSCNSGGFYIYPGKGKRDSLQLTPEGVLGVPVESCRSVSLNTTAIGRYLKRNLTAMEIADCLVSVVLNVSCELLATGAVRTVMDVDLLTLNALGFNVSTGGVFTFVQQRVPGGVPGILQRMEDLAELYGNHLKPHPLLFRMVNQSVSFDALRENNQLMRQIILEKC